MSEPKLRFAEFREAEEWIKIRLGDFYSSIRNGFVGIATPYYVEKGVKYLQGKNIKNGLIDDKDLIFISEDFHKKAKKSQLKLNDILMVQSGHVGECAIVDENYENANCHALLILSPNESRKVCSQFFVYYFYSPYGKKLIYQIKTGNTIEHVLSTDVKELELFSPTLPEQQKIAACLSSLDELITAQAQKVEALKIHKKGLMQQLFPIPIPMTLKRAYENRNL